MKNKFKLLVVILSTLLIMNLLFSLSINASSNVSDHVLGIKNNEVYYIVNASTGRLLHSDTLTSGEYASVSTKDQRIMPTYWSSYATKWQLIRLSNGYFEIYGGEGNGAILKTFGSSVETECNDNNNQSKFILSRADSGTYTIKCVDNGYYLTENTTTHSVFMKNGTEASSYWSLMAVEKRTSDFYTFNYTYTENGITKTYNTATQGSAFLSAMETMGYDDAYHLTNFSYIEFMTTYLQEDDIFIFYGNGAPGEIRFYGNNYALNGQLMANSAMAGVNDHNQYFIDSIPDNGLCQSRCVILLADNVGNSSGSYNMVDAIYEKGAHFVLGITESNMNIEQVDAWLNLFFDSIETGASIQDALNDADEEITISYKCCGDTVQYLKMGS